MARKAAKNTPRARLVDTVRRGGVTLVLGAGVSLELGAPNWRDLAIRIWERALATSEGVAKVDREKVEKLVREPQMFPLIFELAQQRLGHQTFAETLRSCVYEQAAGGRRDDTGTTLGAIAEALIRDYDLGSRRRIVRVITFNADELLREALRSRREQRGQFWRTMDHAVSEFPSGRGDQPVPIYHVHGFLPRGGLFAGLSEHRLVFTDSQYWDSGTSQASFANRTMNSALSDSHCVFIGLSMTDPNLLRWLALRYNEIAKDAAYQTTRLNSGFERYRVEDAQRDNADVGAPSGAASEKESEQVKRKIMNRLGGHFWIRASGDDQTGLLSEFLLWRGVEAVEISAWQDGSFSRLFNECFPED